MADNQSSSPLSKIRAGVKAGVKENIAGAKKSAVNSLYDVPVFGTILKNINKEMQGGASKSDQASAAAESMDRTLGNIEKSVIQISDNIYNIAAAVGAQLTSMKDTEESIRQQREEAQRAKEASADARPAGAVVPDAKPVTEPTKGGGVLSGVSSTITKLGSGLMSFLTNPYVLVAGLVAAIGYGVYKYFTDDGFKSTINDMFQSVMDFDVMENIVKPLGDIFINIGAGLAKLAGKLMKWVADISISTPEFAQKTLGMPADLKPFGFMKEAGDNLEGWADSIFKQRRDEKAAKKAAEDAARPPEAKASSGAPAGFGGAGPASGPATTWSESVETAHAQAMPSASSGGLMGIAAKFIATYEGLPAGGKAFWDPPGQRNLVSVGYGHQIQDHEYKQGFIQVGSEQIPLRGERGVETVLSKEQAQALLAQDLPKYEKRAAAPLGEAWTKLNDSQKAALISYAYNTGSTATLVKNGLKDAILSGDMSGAAQIISEKGVRTAGGQVVGGLVKRRAAEGALFASSARQGATATTVAATPAAAPPPPTKTADASKPSGGQNDSSLAAPVKQEVPAATAQQAEPTSGSAISNLSADVSNLKLGTPESNIAVDNSQSNNSRMASFLTGGIPTPIADRCSIDRFNFFEPFGNMKIA